MIWKLKITLITAPNTTFPQKLGATTINESKTTEPLP